MKRIEREKGGVRSSHLLSTWLSWEPLTSGTCHGPLLAGPGSWLPLPGPQGSTQTGGRTGETLQEWSSVDLQGQGSEWAQSWMPSQHVGWNRGQRWGRLMNLDNKHSVGMRVAVVRDRPQTMAALYTLKQTNMGSNLNCYQTLIRMMYTCLPCLTSRPKGQSQPRELWFLLYSWR